ncbi:head GIN domain-containing protein [Winogradskyella maritima]|uniref:Head GIN domain-containing protein n=1 Tax=Winogradskyella maritima TaxID=1517766 RepID=A0ABV8ACH8_9FLAO|nr:head GIN domain-containing protein [Winogradskyella maritima]
MKKLCVIILILGFWSCDTENAPDCIQTAGSIIQQDFTVDSFDKILINREIELVISEGPNYEVTVETGENLLNDISVEVLDGRLVLTDNNTCNYVRDFGITKVYVTTPTLTEIRCSTQYDISSDGVLTFPTLRLISENFNEPDSFPIGDFKLNIQADNLRIGSNNLSFYYLEGQVENLVVNFFSGNGRFEGENLIAQNISIFHRGSNDMILNPQQSLTGSIRSTGNVISKNQPPTVEVEEVFTGRLIFE